MALRLAMTLITVVAACGGSNKPAAEPEPVAEPEPEPEPEPADDAPPLATDTDAPEPPAAPSRPIGDHTGSIRGTVTNAADGKPLAGVTVFLRGPDGMMSTTTDGKGNYEITGVPPGTHEVTFSYKKTDVVAEIEVEAASETVAPVAMSLSKTAPVIVH